MARIAPEGERLFDAAGQLPGQRDAVTRLNLTGDNIWAAADEGDGRIERNEGSRPLRSAPKANLLAP